MLQEMQIAQENLSNLLGANPVPEVSDIAVKNFRPGGAGQPQLARSNGLLADVQHDGAPQRCSGPHC